MTDAIFSIKHRYAEHIYSGHKCVELRRTTPKMPIERAWIYETAPVKMVTGWFEPGLIHPPMRGSEKRNAWEYRSPGRRNSGSWR
jgi:predicted transcriptional regulator